MQSLRNFILNTVWQNKPPVNPLYDINPRALKQTKGRIFVLRLMHEWKDDTFHMFCIQISEAYISEKWWHMILLLDVPLAQL